MDRASTAFGEVIKGKFFMLLFELFNYNNLLYNNEINILETGRINTQNVNISYLWLVG